MGDAVDRDDLLLRALDGLIAARRDPAASMALLVELICSSGLADHAHLYLVEPDDLHLRLAAVHATDPEAALAFRDVMARATVRLDSSLPGRAMAGGHPIVLNHLREADLPIPAGFLEHIERYDVQHMATVPVPGDDRPVGALMTSRTGSAPGFDDEDVALLVRLAAIASFGLDRVALQRRIARQADILDRVADAVLAVDENRVVTKWNHGAERLYGIRRQDALGHPLSDLLTTVSHEPGQLDAAWGELTRHDGWRDTVRQVTRDGRVVEVEASVTRLDDGESGFAGAVAVNRDISHLLRSQRELAERQSFAEALLDALGGRTAVIGTDGRVRAVNERYEKEGPFGAGPGSGPDVGADALAFLALMAKGAPGVGLIADAVRSTLAGQPRRDTVDVLSHDGTWTEARVQAFRGPGGGALVSFVDVSERKVHELELAHQATHDALTGLANRALLLDRLRESLGRAFRRGHRVAVMFVDLDGLKAINDTRGHAAGDAALVATADRLTRGCRVIDTVGRLGGDEFVVLLDEVDDTAEADALAHRMMGLLGEPGDAVGPLSASIGVALAEGIALPTEDDAADLLGHADAAMLIAKRTGKGQVVLVAQPIPGRPPADAR
jgi:diguanylate cyclase (GGDEF)-like protein/PAS domain S-box-containing protein